MKPTMTEVSEKISKPGEEDGVELSEAEQPVSQNGLGRSLSGSTGAQIHVIASFSFHIRIYAIYRYIIIHLHLSILSYCYISAGEEPSINVGQHWYILYFSAKYQIGINIQIGKYPFVR